MPYVASTLTADNAYTEYEQGGNDMKIPVRKVLIKGGIGVANKMLVTPTGATITEVSEDELAMLQKNSVFKVHLEKGHVKILGKKADGDKVASDMVTRDKSAPLSPAHYKDKKDDDPSVLSVNTRPAA